jgi:hypothetical protein
LTTVSTIPSHGFNYSTGLLFSANGFSASQPVDIQRITPKKRQAYAMSGVLPVKWTLKNNNDVISWICSS